MKSRCLYAFEDISRGGKKILYCNVVHGCIPAAGDFEVSNDTCIQDDESRCAVYRMLADGELSDEFVRYLNGQDGFYLFRAVAIPNELGEERKQAIKTTSLEHDIRVDRCLPNEFAEFYLTKGGESR